MKPHSLDLRERIVDAFDRGEVTGPIGPAPRGGGLRRILRRRDERALRALVRRGDVVVLDRLGEHRVLGARRAIEALAPSPRASARP